MFKQNIISENKNSKNKALELKILNHSSRLRNAQEPQIHGQNSRAVHSNQIETSDCRGRWRNQACGKRIITSR